jgi:hypothetical protein
VFGSENTLRFFRLLPPTHETNPTQFRHTLGFGCSAQAHKKIPLPFFRLLPRFGSLTALHNRQVEGSSGIALTMVHSLQRLE